MRRVALSLVLASGLAAAPALASQAFAGTLSAADVATNTAILSDFNAVILNNLSSTSEIDQRVVVGGGLNTGGSYGNNQYCHNNCGGDVTLNGLSYGGLTVYGNVGSSGSVNAATMTSNNGDIQVGGTNYLTLELAHSGNAYVAGNNAGKISDGNLYVTGSNTGSVQNGNAYTGQPTPAVFAGSTPFATAFQTPLTNLSSALATLTATQTITTPGQSNYTFSTTPSTINGEQVSVYDIAASVLSTFTGNTTVNVGSASVVVINVTGTPTGTLPLVNTFSGSSDVIWNFVNATSLSFSTWAGTVLAPDATVTDPSGSMDGPLVAATFNQTNEVHANPFTGNLAFLDPPSPPVAVPEPSALALLGTGLLSMGLFVRRKARRKPDV
jgi:choice-of-anchor A domain-containing protein